ncbi:C39 family peptidase [Persicirhabdus sediminis]|uniref:C39 family peptidase n=1 Tax=Persicirhabdus sediminis TaxID=454144 RepID=A0A8J7MAV3_9BACT|nr:C39 family peptidase [Persicirhabdus sediminis]MBK1789653.1 C39 family peptidase [Persicirhabdus sediminis]
MLKFLLPLLIILQLSHAIAGKKKTSVPLDELINFPSNWEMTSEEFEQEFAKGKSKYYKWLTADKSRAKMNSITHSNGQIVLNLFDKKLKVEEVIVDFADDKLNLVTFSIYNRGDMGEISSDKLNEIYMLTGKSMGEALQCRPNQRKADPRNGLLTEGYSWNSPKGIALLEYNEGALGSQTPEFLRLRVANKSARSGLAASMLNSRGGASIKSSKLKDFLVEDKEGNVFIKGIPMVDQGRKGYCVVASVQRLFEHFGIGADMHQLAQITNADPQMGTNTLKMADALGDIDYRFKTRLKIIGMMGSNGRMVTVDQKRDVYYQGKELDERRVLKAIRDSINIGVPLLWSLELGKYQEEPNLNPQTQGGHMRIIIGYNDDQEKIIFSDSWGAGHEFKTMKMRDAYHATKGLFTLKPTVN